MERCNDGFRAYPVKRRRRKLAASQRQSLVEAMRKILTALTIATLAVTFSTPSPGPTCSNGNCSLKGGGGSGTKHLETVQPPDPCAKFKNPKAHEKCVTRELNKGGHAGTATMAPPHPDKMGNSN
jgi:hypothetical protein